MKPSAKSHKNWDYEYTALKGIHLEYTDELPVSVHCFHEIIRNELQPGFFHSIADIGCGKGRIGIHLAKLGYIVYGLDFVSRALNEFRLEAEKMNLVNLIKLIKQDVNKHWSIDRHSVEGVFAITVIDNLIADEQRELFRSELLRILKPGGLFVVEYYTAQDGYYGKLLNNSPQKKRGIIYDPNNNLMFKMYSKNEVIALAGDDFEVLCDKTIHTESIKYEHKYNRTLELLIFRRK